MFLYLSLKLVYFKRLTSKNLMQFPWFDCENMTTKRRMRVPLHEKFEVTTDVKSGAKHMPYKKSKQY